MNNTALDLVFPAVGGKEVVSRNDGGEITSDAGFLLLSLADGKLGLTQAMSDAMNDPREQGKVVHGIVEMSRERIYAICQDYEDANDLCALRHDPALKTACMRPTDTGPVPTRGPERWACAIETAANRMADKMKSRLMGLPLLPEHPAQVQGHLALRLYQDPWSRSVE
jgi:hypothetical protein